MKSELRKKNAAERNGINDKANKDEAISAAFLCSDFYINADEILCYYPIKSEISTIRIIKTAQADCKTIFLPLCSADSGVMRFYQCISDDDLRIGKYGIPERIPINARRLISSNAPFASCLDTLLIKKVSGLATAAGIMTDFLPNSMV
jgi:5,10-methenyltetrahydrofolate synthetase